MGTGIYKGGAEKYVPIGNNLENIETDYGFSNGYFGTKGDSSNNKVRHIVSDSPVSTSKDFYDKLTYGGIEHILKNNKGTICKMADGTVVTWRENKSSDGSPVVDINIKKSKGSGGIKSQKIHFVFKGGENNGYY